MKAVLCAEQASPTCGCARKFNGLLHAFATAAPEVHLAQLAASNVAKSAGQLASEFRYVALQHGRTATVHFVFQGLYYIGMVVADVMDAVAGEVIENTPSVSGEKLRAKAPLILHVHLQEIEQCGPPRIDISCVVGA